ncbi:hypothetical protein MKW98_013312 [Papaver atlanticum]|uniref:Uncharacterized protein n=1 Tax=Papaver atlanticum TaxID=357466 RepID=A0AAD4XIQ9_9MAGN|nr:hypothetical protein MKW98_013312 [Papaver atlanticum]
MSQALWEKSPAWRWLVTQTKVSKPFFFTFATVCGVIPGVIGFCVMQLTNSSNPQLEAHLRKNASPDSLMMGKVNQERLAEYLGELQRKENTNDRRSISSRKVEVKIQLQIKAKFAHQEGL